MKKTKPTDQVKTKNPTVGFRPAPDVKTYLEAVEKLRPGGVERSDIVNTAIGVAAKHADPAALLKLVDKRTLENAAADLEAQLAAVRAALAQQTVQ